MIPNPFTTDITSPYTFVHAWAYEHVVAPAVLRTRSVLDEAFVPHLPPGARILDVGCGGAKFSSYVAERRDDVVITGVDISAGQVARAAADAGHLGARVRFRVGSALDLPFPAASFDAVLSCGSIKHWPDRARGLAECLRVLRPGGPLLITEADRSCTFADARNFVRRWPIPAPIRPLALGMFRTWIAGQSIDLDDARTLCAGARIEGARVERIADSPLLMIAGRARA